MDGEEGLEFRILGPLEARRNGAPVELGGPKQRALLALLLLRAGEVVSTDRLIDELWGEQPPAKAAHTVQVFVSRLRKALGATAILTSAPGYQAVGELDLERFRHLVAEASRSHNRGEAEKALEALREALGLWRGPALAEFAYEPWAGPHLERLEEERLAATEERLKLELELGRGAHLVGELEELAARQPLRERVHGLLMLALYRTGRQTDALEVYGRLKRRLLDELGLDPDPDLQALERQILQQDAALGGTPKERRRLPEGTVTFLFTDIEGSTALLTELGSEHYATLTAAHRNEIRAACTAHGGLEVDTQGDAFFLAFPTAPGALAAAAASQAALAALGIKVRMGLHTGTPLLTDEGYVGLDVHRAARIAAAGHGGQVLVSGATKQLLDGEFELRDLGEHRLKDMTAPQRLYQLGRGEFPPLKTLNRTNLPVQLTALLGREHELAQLAELLARPEARLVTLTGPGGAGKTRLALQASAEAADSMPDGVFWVSLAPIPSAELVLPAIARALDVREAPGETLDQTLRSYLTARRMLLVLDNFEHVLEARAVLRELLSECPQVRALVTSRTTLSLSGEHVYEVPPLRERDAVDLFVERARHAGIEVSPDAVVGTICDRLDRLPLAIELAAARTRLLEPPALLERLERRLPLLKGASDLPDRQQTLHATIAWSHDLLDDEERILFRRLSVFAGSFTPESAEAVTEADLWTLESLVAKSLVRRWGSGRFGLLETIREFAAEQLEQADEVARLREAHANHYLQLALELEPFLSAGERRATSVDQLAAELDNLRAALIFFESKNDGERLLELATMLWRFWMAHGYFGPGRSWLERGLDLARHPSDPLRARALEGLGVMCLLGGDFVDGERWTAEGLALFRLLGDTRGEAESLNNLGFAAVCAGDHDRGEEFLQEAARLARATGESVVVALATGNLAELATERAQFSEAIVLLEESAAIYELIGDRGRMAMELATRGRIHLREAQLDDAARSYAASLELADALPQREFTAVALVGIAEILRQRGDPERAAELVGAADGLVEIVGASWASLTPTDREVRDRVLVETRASLGDDAFGAAYGSGLTLSFGEGVSKALSTVTPVREHSSAASSPPAASPS